MESDLIIKGLILNYGVPGCGKTYFSHDLIKSLPNHLQSLIVYIEIDEIEYFTLKNRTEEIDFLSNFELFFKKQQSMGQVVSLVDFLKISDKQAEVITEFNLKDEKKYEIQNY